MSYSSNHEADAYDYDMTAEERQEVFSSWRCLQCKRWHPWWHKECFWCSPTWGAKLRRAQAAARKLQKQREYYEQV